MAKNEYGPEPKLHSSYYPWRRDVAEVNDEPSMTRQEMSEDCDINVIMKRYERTGMMPFQNGAPPQYLDLTVRPESLIEAMNVMIDAENAFMTLPATVRKEFDNDPMRFVEYASDAENIERMREWGLAPPAPVEPPPGRVVIVGTTPADDVVVPDPAPGSSKTPKAPSA